MSRTWTVAVGLFFASLTGSVQGADWPQFRGPGGAGLTDESKLPAEWSVDKNIRWKVQVPGVGWSSPVVWGNKVFLTTAVTENQAKPAPFPFGEGRPGGGRRDGNRPPREQPPADDANQQTWPEKEEADRPAEEGRRRRGGGGGFGGQAPDADYRFEVYCLDRTTGDILWKRVATERKPAIPTHSTNTYASETPATDGERVYAYFGMTGLFCFDLEGNPIWNKDLGAYPMFLGWGTGSSPVLAGDNLILQCDNDQASFLVALDKKTGEEKWRVAREDKSCWSTPCLWRNKLRTELVVASSQRVVSYNPADGAVLWELTGFKGRCSATPVGDDERVYLGTGGGMAGSGPLVAVRAGAAGSFAIAPGKEQPEQIAWKLPRGGPPMASPLVYQGYLYILEERGGLLSCYNAADGTRAYQQRVPDAKGFTSSPWANDGKIFCLDAGGQTFVLRAGPQFELLGENKLDEMCWATPAAADGTVFLRTTDHLWCIKL